MRNAVAVLVLLLTAGCGDAGAQDQEVLRVFAAASLSTAFAQLAEDFEADHPGVDVQLDLGGSSDLASQVAAGAPADVVAFADAATMDRLAEQDLLAGEPRIFATNVLEIAVAEGNPLGITGLADLEPAGDQRLDLVVCAPEVPCGGAARRAAEAAGVDLEPVSEEQSVTDVLGKVASGQAEAGLVYATDVLAADDAVDGIAIPEASESVNTYPAAPVAEAAEPGLARNFVDALLADAGQRVLRDAGFGAP